jgi:O-antigen/teichoic acid export membrane protein
MTAAEAPPAAASAPEPLSRISRHVVRSTASNVVGQLLIMCVWFGLTPFIVQELGAADYGLWMLVASIVAYGNLLDLGVGSAVTKYVAELRAVGRSEQASDLIATALRMYCAIGILVIAATVPFALVFPHLFHIAPHQQSAARWVVLLTGVGLAVQLPAATAYAVLRGLQRFDLNNLISVTATLTQGLVTVLVLLLGGGVIGLAATVAPLTLLTQIPMQIVIRRIAPDLRFGWRGARRALLPTVASFSAALVVINGGAVLKTKTDEIVIAGALPVAAVAPYSIARRVAELPTLLTYQFVRILFPLASELHGAGDHARIRTLYVASTRVTLALFVPIGSALMVLAQPFLVAWVGPQYAADARVTVILVAAAMLDIAIWQAACILQGTNAHRMLALFGGSAALLNLGLSIVLVRSIGVVGVALGTLIAAGLEVLVVVPFAMRRYRVRAVSMVRDALAPALLPAVPSVCVLLLARAALTPSSIPAVGLVGALGGLVYAAGYLSFAASSAERLLLLRLLRTGQKLARARA